MGIVRERTSKAFEINDLAHVTKACVNKEYILSESSVRMPISDYLAQYSGEVVLEKNIDAFKQRKFDLFFERNGCSNYFEFKYVQPDYTKTGKEIQRFFNDLLRLKVMAQKWQTECFLVVCGSKKDFFNEFMGNKGIDKNAFNPWHKPYCDRENIYRKMFRFEKGLIKYIDFNDIDIKNLKNNFLYGRDKYILSNEFCYIYPHFFDDFFYVKTTCISLQIEDTSLSAVGIWKIEDGIS